MVFCSTVSGMNERVGLYMNTLVCGVDRWADDQLFEEDLRAVLLMLRPNRRERMAGWSEYRTGGAGFRVTVSWSDDFPRPGETDMWRIPRLEEVMESLLVGSVQGIDEMSGREEFELYRKVIDRLGKRLNELEPCYCE